MARVTVEDCLPQVKEGNRFSRFDLVHEAVKLAKQKGFQEENQKHKPSVAALKEIAERLQKQRSGDQEETR